MRHAAANLRRPREREQLYHHRVEGRDGAGVVARDQAAADHDLLIYPIRPGVLEIGRQRRPED
jgi:hypothetical protein